MLRAERYAEQVLQSGSAKQNALRSFSGGGLSMFYVYLLESENSLGRGADDGFEAPPRRAQRRHVSAHLEVSSLAPRYLHRLLWPSQGHGVRALSQIGIRSCL